MKFLIFDTETTGIPFYGPEHPAHADYQPRMCSIAMALVDETGAIEDRYHGLVKPLGWPLKSELFMERAREAEAVHGISMERLEVEGRPIEAIYGVWSHLYDQADATCGYNIWFDHKIIRGEWARIGYPVPFRDKPGVCLMKGTKKHLGVASIKLQSAVERILQKQHVGAHDAEADLSVSIELFTKLLGAGALVSEEQPGTGLKASSQPINPRTPCDEPVREGHHTVFPAPSNIQTTERSNSQ